MSQIFVLQVCVYFHPIGAYPWMATPHNPKAHSYRFSLQYAFTQASHAPFSPFWIYAPLWHPLPHRDCTKSTCSVVFFLLFLRNKDKIPRICALQTHTLAQHILLCFPAILYTLFSHLPHNLEFFTYLYRVFFPLHEFLFFPPHSFIFFYLTPLPPWLYI